VSRFFAVPVLVCGLTAAVVPFAGNASAIPCDAADCVPNVARNVIQGAPCVPGKFYAFGLAADSATLVCSTAGVWAPAGPLVGVREVALPCYAPLGSSAQGPDGIPLLCADINAMTRWAHRVDTPG
jgi:hypothetical protein